MYIVVLFIGVVYTYVVLFLDFFFFSNWDYIQTIEVT